MKPTLAGEDWVESHQNQKETETRNTHESGDGIPVSLIGC